MKDLIKIPHDLHSSATGEPFHNCLVCDRFLLKEDTPYLIEKSVRYIPEMNLHETLFEYAICIPCSMEMNAALSVESRQRIDEYFMTHADLGGRMEMLQAQEQPTFQDLTKSCIVKGTPIAGAREYQIIAQCDGERLVLSHMPFAISFEAIDEITQLLSAKSLGEIDGFIGKYFTGPPEVSAILKRRIVFI